jgi:hypothetical protein
VRDQHGRFPGTESLPWRAGFLYRAVVDDYAALLRAWLREIGIDVPEPERMFSVLLTHDVDRLAKYADRLGASALGRLRGVLRNRVSRWPEAARVALGRRRDPSYHYDELLRLDRLAAEQPGAPHIDVRYFFMAGGSAKHDTRYDVTRPFAQRLIAEIRASGAGIGLHPSYSAGGQPELRYSKGTMTKKYSLILMTRRRFASRCRAFLTLSGLPPVCRIALSRRKV